MAFSKIIFNDETLIDLTQDTVDESTLFDSYTAHDASGQAIVGEATGGGDADAVLEGTISELSNSTVTSLKANVFREDTAIEYVDLPNVTTINANAFYSASNLKSINIPRAATFGSSLFYGCYNLIRFYAPSIVGALPGSFLRVSYMLVTADFGSGITQLSQSQSFSDCPNMSELVLRNTNSVVTLQNTNVFETNHMSFVMQKIGHVYVPKTLIPDYKTTSNWSTIYGLNSNIFRGLEDYTVDGTTTGALDYSKVYSTHVPDYSLENETFDGTKVINTGVQLFDGGSGAFTIVFSISGVNGANSARILSCVNSNSIGMELYNNGNYASSAYLRFSPVSSENSSLLGANSNDYMGFIRSDGLNAYAVVLNSNKVYKANQRLRRTGTVQTLTETLLVGGALVNGTPTGQWKGTIHMLKVFKSCLNPNEIIDLLGLEN